MLFAQIGIKEHKTSYTKIYLRKKYNDYFTYSGYTDNKIEIKLKT